VQQIKKEKAEKIFA